MKNPRTIMLALLFALSITANSISGEAALPKAAPLPNQPVAGTNIEQPAQPPETTVKAQAEDSENDVQGLLKTAQDYELSNELYSAQDNYQQALQTCIKLAEEGKESSYNYAVAEFITEKLLEITLRSADNRGLLKALENLPKTDSAKQQHKIPQVLSSRIEWAKLQLYMRTGKTDKAKQIREGLNLLNNWMLLKGADVTTGSAEVFDSPDGLLCPGEFFSQKDWKKIRLQAIVNSKSELTAAVRLGFNTQTHVFINGFEAHSEDNGAAEGFDRTVFPIKLQKGDNLLTVELDNAEVSPAGYIRLTGIDGSTLEDISIKSPADSAITEKLWQLGKGEKASPIDADIDTGALKLLAALVKNDPADHASAYYLGYLLLRRQNFGPHSKEARELLMKAIRKQPDAGIYYLAFASAADESARLKPDQDENLKRMMLQKAISVNDSNIAALCLLGDYYLNSQNSPTRAQEYAEKALKKNPSSISANVLQGFIYLKRGWPARALKLAQELSQRNRSFPQVCAFRALAEMAAGTPENAESAWSTELSANRTNPLLTRKLSQSLRNRGEIKRATTVLEIYLSIRPYDTDIITKLANFKLQNSELDSVDRLIKRLNAINPETAPVLKLSGEFAQAKGQHKEALDFLTDSLKADPGQAKLRDYLAYQNKTLPSILDEIPDLAEFASGVQQYRPPAGENTAILLTETADDLHEDGTRERTFHRIAKIYNREGINEFSRIPVWHDATNEIVKVRLMRVLHPDGSISVGQTATVPRPDQRRITLIMFPGLQTGDVVEIWYDIIQTRPGFFGDYFGVSYNFRQFAPTLKSRYILRYPQTRKMYFHQTGDTPKPDEITENSKIIKTWEMEKLDALQPLPLMPPLEEMSPTVQVCSFANWDDMAKWYWRLIKSQNITTEAIREEVARIAPQNKSPREKLSAIYNWVSNNVRNNAWEFGIHGYKPYNAEAIFTRRFGDCKDKATLINVMAREAGFEAWPVLLRAIDPAENRPGRGEENLELPLLSHFNHCISMVEAGGERYYLDGTIAYQNIDSQSMTDRGAGAVIVRPSGAEIVKLPKHTPQSNLWNESLRVNIDDKGSADMGFSIKASGQPALFMRSWFRNPATWDNVMRAIGTQLYGRVSGVTVDDVINSESEKDTVILSSRLRIKDYASLENKSMQISLPKIIVGGELGKGGAVPEKFASFAQQTVRELPLILPTLFKVKRSISIEWPDGWTLDENLPPVNLDYPFGTLKIKYSLNDNLLQIEYLLELKQLKISPEEYRDFRRFCLQADRAAAQRLEIRHN